MSSNQQVVYRYTIDMNGEPRIQIPWHPQSKVLHVALLEGSPERVHFWVAMPVQDGPLPSFREFYVVGTGMNFPAEDVVEGVTVWEGDGRMLPRIVWQLIRHEPQEEEA